MPPLDAFSGILANDHDNGLLLEIQKSIAFVLSFNNIVDAVTKIWKTPILRFFTGHDPEHSIRILQHLGLLTARCDLTADESYVLVAAVFLHDIGMQRVIEGKTEDDIRREHEELSARWVLDSVATPPRAMPLGVLEDYADAIAQVIRGHRAKDLQDRAYADSQVPRGKIRIRLLILQRHLIQGHGSLP